MSCYPIKVAISFGIPMGFNDFMLSMDGTPFGFLTTMRYVDFTSICVLTTKGIGYSISPSLEYEFLWYFLVELVINIVSNGVITYSTVRC